MTKSVLPTVALLLLWPVYALSDSSLESRIQAQSCLASSEAMSPLAAAAWESVRRSPPSNSPVPLEYALTYCNRLEGVYIDGPNIFAGLKQAISGARHTVDIAFFGWEDDTDAARLIGEGLAAAGSAMSREHPIRVRIIVSDQRNFISGKTINNIFRSVNRWNLDRSKVRVHLATNPVGNFLTPARGAMHDKYVVIDGSALFVTGANPQDHHDVRPSSHDAPWHDTGYLLSGPVARASLRAFDAMWTSEGKYWRCRMVTIYPSSTIGGVRRRLPPETHPDCDGVDRPALSAVQLPEVSHHPVGRPMIVVGRKVDNNCDLDPADIKELAIPQLHGAGTLERLAAFAALPRLEVIDEDRVKNRCKNRDENNPQDRAWVALFRNATSHIHVETPNINDDGFRREVLAAINRGVKVDIVTSRRFNDGPGIEIDGGDNVEVAQELLHAARRSGGFQNLSVCWYSVDGRAAVLGNGSRASHTKFMSADGLVAVVGSGNMDTQSWNHESEFNVLIDGKAEVAEIEQAFFASDRSNCIVEREWRSAPFVWSQELVEGSGPAVRAGQKVSVKQMATRADDTPVAGRQSIKPVSFKVGAGDVLRLLDHGVVGMRVGGRRRLRAPECWIGATANRQNMPIPCQFEVELMSID